MKTTLRLLALTASLSFASSCSDSSSDPQPTPSTQASLLGKWKGVSLRIVTKSPTSQVISDETTDFTGTGYGIEITATELWISGGSTPEKRGPYTRTGNVLHAGTTDEPNDLTIEELTANRLVMTSEGVSGADGENKSFRTFVYYR